MRGRKRPSARRLEKLLAPGRVRFSRMLEVVLVAPCVGCKTVAEVLEARAARPLAHASRHVRDRALEKTFAKPRPAPTPRARVERRLVGRAIVRAFEALA